MSKPKAPTKQPNQPVYANVGEATGGIHECSVRETLDRAPSWTQLEDVACHAAKLDTLLDSYFAREEVPFDPALHQLREELCGALLKIGYCRGGSNEASLKKRGFL